MSEQLDTKTGWLSRDELENARANVPLVYVDAVPVKVDELGRVTHVGLLLRQAADGTISRMVVSGRVLYGERIRDAVLRHLEKDLGPLALPRIPPGAVHRGRVIPRCRGQRLPRPAPPCGQPGLRRSRRRRLPAHSAGARPALVHPRGSHQRRGAPRDDRRPRPPHPPRSGTRRPAALTPGRQAPAALAALGPFTGSQLP